MHSLKHACGCHLDFGFALTSVFLHRVRRPPPPPGLLKRSPLARLAIFDPEGFALAEQTLDDFFPPLEYVASHSTGSRIRNKYGPKYFVNKYELSMAFMATESFEDKNSISARMIQARLTNYGRFSCIAMLEFASENDNSAAGTSTPISSRFNNPDDYASPWDRNWILYFATIFTESLRKEVGASANLLEVNVLEFWQQQCEEPAAYRAPVPTEMWQADRQRLGTTDAFDTSVEVRDFAPLVAFGSLRQLRSENGPAAEQWPEDPTTNLFIDENIKASTKYAGKDTTDYGRRRRAEETVWNTNGLNYRDENVSFSTMGSRASPSAKRRGRALFMETSILKLIKKALGDPFAPTPYKDMERTFDFEVPRTRRPHLYYDYIARQTNVAKDLLRDVFCNPDYDLTVEQVVGNPPPHEFSDMIVDSSSATRAQDMITYGTLRGGDVNRGYGANGPRGSTPSYKDTSLQSWVYVTSSDDSSVEPGFHRLADLKIWPDIECNKIKSQPCGSLTQGGSGSTTAWLALAWFQLFFNILDLENRRKLQVSTAITYIKNNDVEDYVEPSALNYRKGTEALLNARCSTWLASNGVQGATECVGDRTAWYSSSSNGCSKERLELVDTSIYEPRSLYLSRFTAPTPPPRPPPKSPPPSPPSPPAPSPPPTPPQFASLEDALAFAAKIQRDFCDSVFILSGETRCNALAKELHVQFQLDDTWRPPALPPIAPENSGNPPPPPPRPPSPNFPIAESRIIRMVPIYSSSLSTYFLPTVAPSPPPYAYTRRKLQLAPSEIGVTVDSQQRSEIQTALEGVASDPKAWAACTDSAIAAGAPLSCRTSGNPDRCIDGARHCGTVAQNTFEPFLELDFKDYVPDYNGRMYLFMVKVKLPANEEYAKLIFHPLETYGGDTQENRGWRLTVFDDHHHELPVQCQDWNYGASATEYTEGLVDLQHLCLKPSAEESEYEVLTRARYLRLTLIGNYRQIWIDHIDVYFRAIVDGDYNLLNAPSPPPPTPETSPTPPATPDTPFMPPTAFVFYQNEVKSDWQDHVVAYEPCGLTREECCVHANEMNSATNGVVVDSFVLSATGCCALTRLGEIDGVDLDGSYGSGSGSGSVLDDGIERTGWELYQAGSTGGTGLLL